MKWKVISTVLLVAFVFVACGRETSDASDIQSGILLQKFNMEYESTDFALGVSSFYLYRDAETGVEYIVVTDANGIAITPRLQANTYVKCAD